LDELEKEEALIPHLQSHAKTVCIPEALLDELSYMLPNQEPISEARPQRKACHRLRKLVRALSGRERKIIRSIYFKELSLSEVSEKMGLNESEVNAALNHAFARLRMGLGQLVS
jgi:RNA polymerase sigma factor (sigma-70 family)